jgi:hypothetical protein
MKIGDLVTYGGRRCYVRGFDPMSVLEKSVYLEDADTAERVKAPLAELELEDDRTEIVAAGGSAKSHLR